AAGAAHRGQGFDIPKGANQEGVLRKSEVVALDIAVDEVAVFELFLNGGDGADEARIRRVEKAKPRHQEETGVERLAFHRRRECIEARIPGTARDDSVDLRRALAPEIGAIHSPDEA